MIPLGSERRQKRVVLLLLLLAIVGQDELKMDY